MVFKPWQLHCSIARAMLVFDVYDALYSRSLFLTTVPTSSLTVTFVCAVGEISADVPGGLRCTDDRIADNFVHEVQRVLPRSCQSHYCGLCRAVDSLRLVKSSSLLASASAAPSMLVLVLARHSLPGSVLCCEAPRPVYALKSLFRLRIQVE